jgi:protein gp37
VAEAFRQRLREVAGFANSAHLAWPANIWMGVSVERQDYYSRINHLRRTKARTRFLSLEPLLGPLPSLDLQGIDWVIVGGESGPRARPMAEEWAVQILDQCRAAKVPFFFKQWGGRNKKTAGRVLNGRTWDEMPSRHTHAPNEAGAASSPSFQELERLTP